MLRKNYFPLILLSIIIAGAITIKAFAYQFSNAERQRYALEGIIFTRPCDDETDCGTEGEEEEGGGNVPSEEGQGVTKFTMCGMTFNVIKVTVNGKDDDGSDGKTGLERYIAEKVRAYHIDQSDKKLYDLNGNHTDSTAQNGHCDIVSRNMAYDMFYDTITSDSCSTGRYDRGRTPSGFSLIQGDGNFQKMYDDIMAGRPAVRRVSMRTSQDAQAQRHYATVVGVKENANREHLDNSDFLFLETFGGGILWNNISGVFGGYRWSNGSCSRTDKQNRFIYESEYYIPTTKTGDDRKDCGT
ncbi:hypothetical protein IK146_01660 [Candidatus Saccharibacteria bacterium]|nr:hypothetical protein [Candidatus Saccharibacteria bacterium]